MRSLWFFRLEYSRLAKPQVRHGSPSRIAVSGNPPKTQLRRSKLRSVSDLDSARKIPLEDPDSMIRETWSLRPSINGSRGFQFWRERWWRGRETDSQPPLLAAVDANRFGKSY